MCLVASSTSCKRLPLLLLQLLWLYFQERVQLARYCHLPVGNMTGDWVLNTADALYARCLRDADHLLWANDPSLPDVAGPASAQVDTSRFLLDQPTMEVCCCMMELMSPFQSQNVCCSLETSSLHWKCEMRNAWGQWKRVSTLGRCLRCAQ